MTLSEFGLRNRYTVYALSIAAVFFGIVAYFSIPIQLFPETAPPLVNILTPFPGASAEDVADLVSDPVEDECAALEGVYRVSSSSQDGLSLVTVEFRYDIDVDMAALDAQNAISRIRGILPPRIQEPQVLKFSTSDRPVLTMGVIGEDLTDVRRLAEDVLAPELQRVEGVALIDVFGGHEPELSVLLDRPRLESYGIPVGSIIAAIRSYNVSTPAGKITSSENQYAFRIDEQLNTIQDFENIPIRLQDGNRLLLGDIAQIHYESAEDLSRYHVNGEPAIAVQVFKQDDANTVDVVLRAQEKIRELGSRYPKLRFVEAEESASFTQQVVENMFGSVAQALILASVIIFLFLGSLRRAIVVVISMPMSFLLTFAGMKLFSIQIDLVTLTAIILAVGMVVDASVVVLENIVRRHHVDKLTAEEAARVGASEIQFAIIAGNATTLIVLVPLLFLYGFVGKTFGPLAATLIIAFLSSLLVALIMVPILTTFTAGKSGRFEILAQKIAAPWNVLMKKTQEIYLFLLRYALRRRWIVFVSSVVLLIIGIVLLRIQGTELLPKMDSGTSFVTVETASGTSLDQTESIIKQVEDIILEEPEVLLLSTRMGFEPGMHSFGGGGVQGPTQGYISITLTPRTERSETIWEIQDRIRQRLFKVPGIENLVVRESGSTARSTTASSIVVSIRGDDPLVLDHLGDQVLHTVSNVPSVVNPYRSWRRDQRTISLNIQRERALEMAITPLSAARDLTESLDGVMAGTFEDYTGDQTPIRVRYNRQYRQGETDAYAVRAISAADGAVIPLGAITTGSDITVQGLVTRENLQPTLDILALHQGRPLNFVAAGVGEAIQGLTIPQGYTVELLGEDKDMAESRNELVFALVIGFVGVYLLLVAQFRSFLHPVTVLTSIPLSLIGVGIALWIAGKAVSMPVMVGLILLVGILVNNSIILIDVIRQRRLEGTTRRDAITASVETRFRPIMMTSLSTIVGMIPLAMEWALGAERFSPLAIAVIGGMTASTLLTMIVIPVLYDWLDDFRVKFSGLFSSKKGQAA